MTEVCKASIKRRKVEITKSEIVSEIFNVEKSYFLPQ